MAYHSRLNRTRHYIGHDLHEYSIRPSYQMDLNDEARITYSYMKDCAIYGIPSNDQDRSFSKLLNWWLFSYTEDLKLFFNKEWINILIIFALFIAIELAFYFYFFDTNL